RAARAVASRLGASRPRAELTLADGAMRIATAADDYDEGIRVGREMVSWAERITPPDELNLGRAHANLGAALARAGQLAEAGIELSAGRALLDRTLGPDHPQIGTLLTIEGALAMARGAFTEARPTLVDAVAHLRRVLGHDHPQVLAPLYNLTRCDLELGRFDDARAEAEDGLALARTQQDQGAAAAQWLSVLAAVHTRAGRPRDAIAPADEALALLRAGGGDDSAIAYAAFVAGRARWNAGVERRRARALVDEALRIDRGRGAAPDAGFADEIERWRAEAGMK
ncbi:MAG: tetratricopeptide repeat protein, partial [Myxococcales bacterium]|nr:tetratricopeptide repeat protein [Myxococcales bacterium]